MHPERTKSLDVTLEAARVLGGASIGYFVTAGNDLIVVTSSGPLNVQKAVIGGLTLDLHTRPLHGVTARVNLTDVFRAQDLTAGEQRLPRRPVIVSNVDGRRAGAPAALLSSVGIVAHSVGLNADPLGSAQPFTRVDAYARLRIAPRALLSLRVYHPRRRALRGERRVPNAGRIRSRSSCRRADARLRAAGARVGRARRAGPARDADRRRVRRRGARAGRARARAAAPVERR